MLLVEAHEETAFCRIREPFDDPGRAAGPHDPAFAAFADERLDLLPRDPALADPEALLIGSPGLLDGQNHLTQGFIERDHLDDVVPIAGPETDPFRRLAGNVELKDLPVRRAERAPGLFQGDPGSLEQ